MAGLEIEFPDEQGNPHTYTVNFEAISGADYDALEAVSDIVPGEFVDLAKEGKRLGVIFPFLLWVAKRQAGEKPGALKTFTERPFPDVAGPVMEAFKSLAAEAAEAGDAVGKAQEASGQVSAPTSDEPSTPTDTPTDSPLPSEQ